MLGTKHRACHLEIPGENTVQVYSSIGKQGCGAEIACCCLGSLSHGSLHFVELPRSSSAVPFLNRESPDGTFFGVTKCQPVACTRTSILSSTVQKLLCGSGRDSFLVSPLNAENRKPWARDS